MSGTTFLTRVVLENYKSIAACDVQLGPLMYLVGPNGAGKSNFLDALEFVSDALNQSLEHALRGRGGFPALCCHSPVPGGLVRIRLEFTLPSQNRGWFSLAIGNAKVDAKTWRWKVFEEECRVGSELNPGIEFYRVSNGVVEKSWVGAAPAAAPDRLFLVRVSDVPPFREVFDALSAMCFYRIAPKSIPDDEVAEFPQRLASDGSNLANVLSALDHSPSVNKDRPEEFLRVVLPTLNRLSVEPMFVEKLRGNGSPSTGIQSRKIALVFHQAVGNSVALFGPRQMSDGTLRTLAILAALYQVNPAGTLRPTLTAIEDVESAIHPAVLAVLRDALTEASLSTQVLAATQSSDLLDSEDVATDSILAVSSDDGLTRIGPVDDSGRRVLHGRLYTVGELLRIGHLSPLIPQPSNLEALSGVQS